jgi:hypothetical protein
MNIDVVLSRALPSFAFFLEIFKEIFLYYGLQVSIRSIAYTAISRVVFNVADAMLSAFVAVLTKIHIVALLAVAGF